MNKKNYMVLANKVGLFLVALFVICFVIFFIRPVEPELHLSLFRLTFVGYNGMNAISFILGLAQSYVWGYIVVGIWRIVGLIGK